MSHLYFGFYETELSLCTESQEIFKGHVSELIALSPSLLQKITCPLVTAVVVAVIGSLQYGYNIGVINAPEEVKQEKRGTLWF